MSLPPADEWARAVEHSRANPAHILGPYEDERGAVHMECAGCAFDTGGTAPEVVHAEARCSLCKMPAVMVGGRWRHAEAADEVFCALLFPHDRGVGSGGSE